MNAGPSSIPVELTHNYPFDSSNQLWGKAYGFNLQGGSCPDLVFVCFLQYYLVAHNSPTLTEPEEAGRNKTYSIIFKNTESILIYLQFVCFNLGLGGYTHGFIV